MASSPGFATRLGISTLRAICASALGLVQLLGAPTMLRADGDDFFEAAEIPGKTEYVVFGNVKDDTGHYLANVTVTIEISDPHLRYDASTDELGRFRTLDIRRAVKDLGYEIYPDKMTVRAQLLGYRTIRRLHRGKVGQNKGAVEINFTMVKN